MEKSFQLLAFGVIQFLDLPKANKENDEKLKINTPSECQKSKWCLTP
jgi:hypothetical protein